MFLSADIVVKAVMIGLAFASLVTWTVFIAKTLELALVKRKLRAALNAIAEATSLAEAQRALSSRRSILSLLLSAAMREARLSAGISSDSGIKERAASSFAEILRAESRRIRLGMGVLATIGATSPFIGLFGTVWGIMNSFIGISKSQTTNLAVVAPGIAEALLATAIGLVAAIPAVIIYNHFSRVTKGYLELVSRAYARGGVSAMGVSIADTDLDDNDFAETHEINVTPFIDVILVLLIIFMVAAPLSTVDLPVDLPTSSATPQKRPDKPTYVTIKPDLAVAIGETQVKRVDLVRSLDQMADASKDRFIFLRADRAVPYGELMDVLEILRAGGYAKIKLVALEGVPDAAAQPAAVQNLKP
jgi:tonB-system energizer ExbB/TonB system transport protein ExbD (group 1)